MDDKTINALRSSLAEGRPEAFAALYEVAAPRLYRAALTLVGSVHDAEDVVQELFVNLAKSHAAVARAENLRAYLFVALRRAASRKVQQCGRGPVHLADTGNDPSSEPCISEGTPREPDAEQLSAAVMRLPAEQREVIALKIDGDLTFAQIAAELNISPNTAASRYRYALEKLRDMLKEST